MRTTINIKTNRMTTIYFGWISVNPKKMGEKRRGGRKNYIGVEPSFIMSHMSLHWMRHHSILLDDMAVRCFWPPENVARVV